MRALLALAIPLIATTDLLAQTAGGIDAKAMLQSLQDIQQKATLSAKSQLTQTISDFSAAAGDDASALNFYMQAVQVTRFAGQEREQTAFQDWKKREMDRLDPMAIRLALRYTTISLQRSAGATDAQIFPVVLAYVQEAQADLAQVQAREIAPAPAGGGGRIGRQGFGGNVGGGEGGADRQIMEKAVNENIFSRWYNIQDKLSNLDKWTYVPADIDGIYQTFLLPIMRKNRDPRVLQYWDDKLATEKNAAASATAEFTTDRYNGTRRPSLLWGRAEDEVVIGMRDQGLTDMFNLVKAFPDHPDATKWVQELKGLLTAAPAVAASGTTATAPQ